tara:strand:- start:890 stop:1510 length:621 start_codon:yes stop_codon:yes gene_type:complete
MKVEEKNNSDLNQDTEDNKKKVNIDVDENEKNKKKISNEDKIKELEDKILRTLAEMENQRRRFEKEKEEAFDFGGFAFAKESLTLIDNLERAQISIKNDENFKKNKDLSKILEAFKIIENDLIAIFKKNDIQQINCLNKKFDPNFHQAMLEIIDTTKEVGTVVQEIQKGYTMKDRLLRPSLVGVTKLDNENVKKDNKNKENNDVKK